MWHQKRASDIKETVSKAMGQGKDKVADGYDGATQKVKATYASAKETTTDETKTN